MGAGSRPKSDRNSGWAPRFNTLLVAVDGSMGSRRAARVAVELAEEFNSRLLVLNVVTRTFPHVFPVYVMVPPIPQKELDDYYAYVKKAATAIVDDTVSLAKERGVEVRREVLVTSSSAVQGITEYAAAERVDLIVMGTRGLGGFRKMLIGSVSSGVVTHAHCPVLVVR